MFWKKKSVAETDKETKKVNERLNALERKRRRREDAKRKTRALRTKKRRVRELEREENPLYRGVKGAAKSVAKNAPKAADRLSRKLSSRGTPEDAFMKTRARPVEKDFGAFLRGEPAKKSKKGATRKEKDFGEFLRRGY